MNKEGMERSATDNILEFELDSGSMCYIAYGGDRLKKNELVLSASHKKTKIVTFTIKTSKEFLETALGIIEKTTKSFLDSDLTDLKTTLGVKKGMCNLRVKVSPVTRVKHSFPVDDDLSWGKMLFTVNDWNKLKGKLELI